VTAENNARRRFMAPDISNYYCAREARFFS
jgi:hypothetical protein